MRSDSSGLREQITGSRHITANESIAPSGALDAVGVDHRARSATDVDGDARAGDRQACDRDAAAS